MAAQSSMTASTVPTTPRTRRPRRPARGTTPPVGSRRAPGCRCQAPLVRASGTAVGMATGGVDASGRLVRAVCRRTSQTTSRPNDSASSPRAASSSATASTDGSTPVTTTASVTPWTAATTLRQYRVGRVQARAAALGEQQRVPGEPDGQDPPADQRPGRDTEDEDEEGVGLHVEPGAQPGDGVGAARHAAVDGVEHQGQGGQAEEETPMVHARERGGHQCGHRLPERGAYQRDAVGRAEPGRPGPVEGDRQQRGRGRGRDQADGPADDAEADRRLEHGQKATSRTTAATGAR